MMVSAAAFLDCGSSADLQCATLVYCPNDVRRVPLSFESAIQYYCRQQCLDLRDKVYGLLAMAETSITVDYTKSVEEVFWDATSELAQIAVGLSIFLVERPGCVRALQQIIRLSQHMVPQWYETVDKDDLNFSERHAHGLTVTCFREVDRPMEEQVVDSLRARLLRILNNFFSRDRYCSSSAEDAIDGKGDASPVCECFANELEAIRFNSDS